jgi:hypothetical protein
MSRSERKEARKTEVELLPPEPCSRLSTIKKKEAEGEQEE